MTDLVIGFAAGYDWPAIEPFAVSLNRSGFQGHKILFVQGLTELAKNNLLALGFTLIAVPELEYSFPEMTKGDFFAYVARFLLIHQFLHENPGYRFVICTDTRDVIFQHDPAAWLEKNIQDKGIVAASEFIRHEDQNGNTKWIEQGFKEVAPWMLDKIVYCSGVISGQAGYIADLTLGIYLMGRHLSGTIWGSDQPAYNALMHQKAYKDATLVPKMADLYCLNMVVLAFGEYRKLMTDLPPVTPTNMFTMAEGEYVYSLPDLSGFTILHQYDRIPPLAEYLREKYSLTHLHDPR